MDIFKFKGKPTQERFGAVWTFSRQHYEHNIIYVLFYLLIFCQCAVLNDVHSTWGVVPRHLLYLEKVLSCHPRHTCCCTTQQQHTHQPRPMHFDEKMSLCPSTTPSDDDASENRRSSQLTAVSLSVPETLDPPCLYTPTAD